MADKSAIEWTEATWNPIRGCSRVSEGCRNCYAERFASRQATFGRAYEGLIIPATFNRGPRWSGEVRFVESALEAPLRWKAPRRIFVNSMSDLFHEKVEQAWIDQIFAVMALAPQHTYQILTKRPERMRAYLGQDLANIMHRWGLASADLIEEALRRRGVVPMPIVPLPNVWLGVSVEDQPTADARIPLLLQTPAAVRWVSYEPALAPVSFRWAKWQPWGEQGTHHLDGMRRLDWIVVGGESGPGARPFDLGWARHVVETGREAGVPVFVKQLGSRPEYDSGPNRISLKLQDRKGGDMQEWQEDLRVREYPA